MRSANTDISGLNVGGAGGWSHIGVKIGIIAEVVDLTTEEKRVVGIYARIAHDRGNEDVAAGADTNGGIAIRGNSGAEGSKGCSISGAGIVFVMFAIDRPSKSKGGIIDVAVALRKRAAIRGSNTRITLRNANSISN